ncbi:MAG: hypothetical protein IKZ28_00760, partial [Clostridia bacterium]|nr:hypothetical protein [Clostridia bacterium]
VEHPEWCIKYNKGEDVQYGAFYTLLCFNSPYLALLCEQVQEVVRTFQPKGIFLDIIAEYDCWCEHCLKDMAEMGLNPTMRTTVKCSNAKYCISITRR